MTTAVFHATEMTLIDNVVARSGSSLICGPLLTLFAGSGVTNTYIVEQAGVIELICHCKAQVHCLMLKELQTYLNPAIASHFEALEADEASSGCSA